MNAALIDAERLVLEPLNEAHAAEMVEVLADSDLYTFTGGTAPTLDLLQQRYQQLVAGPSIETADEIWLNWILRERNSAAAVGYVQATVVGTAAELAWLVGSRYQGRGFASEAAVAMRDWLIASGINELRAYIHPDHKASAAIAISLGLRNTHEVDDDGEHIWLATV